MEIEELMIHDLVLAEEYYLDEEDNEVSVFHPWRITDLSPTQSLWLEGRECMQFGEWLDDCPCEEVGELKPMPLTKEMLEANGFIEDSSPFAEEELTYYESEEGIVLNIESDTMSINGVFSEVHKVQQALRLCGYHVVADKFKVL